jgi:hypothetical protein
MPGISLGSICLSRRTGRRRGERGSLFEFGVQRSRMMLRRGQVPTQVVVGEKDESQSSAHRCDRHATEIELVYGRGAEDVRRRPEDSTSKIEVGIIEHEKRSGDQETGFSARDRASE